MGKLLKDMQDILSGVISEPSITIVIKGENRTLDKDASIYFAMGYCLSNAELKGTSIEILSNIENQH
jgi:hypothetical protein